MSDGCIFVGRWLVVVGWVVVVWLVLVGLCLFVFGSLVIVAFIGHYGWS